MKLHWSNERQEFDAVVVKDETSGYVAFVPAFPGRHTQGDALEELMHNAKGTIELFLETLTDEENKDLLQYKVVVIQKVTTTA